MSAFSFADTDMAIDSLSIALPNSTAASGGRKSVFVLQTTGHPSLFPPASPPARTRRGAGLERVRILLRMPSNSTAGGACPANGLNTFVHQN